MPAAKASKYLGIGFIGGAIGSVGLAVAAVVILVSMSLKPNDRETASSGGIVLSAIGCPSGMIENLATSRCEASKKTIAVIAGSFRKHTGNKRQNPIPASKGIREIAKKMGDDKDKFAAYRIAALLGDAESQYEVGGMLSRGIGTGEDDLEALRWLHEAAHNNHLQAQLKLAQMLSSGTYVQQDKSLAQEWLQKAEANKIKKARQIAELVV